MSNVQAHWYDLNTEIKNIKHEVVQNSTDRHTKLLTKEKDFRLVLISMKKGAVRDTTFKAYIEISNQLRRLRRLHLGGGLHR